MTPLRRLAKSVPQIGGGLFDRVSNTKASVMIKRRASMRSFAIQRSLLVVFAVAVIVSLPCPAAFAVDDSGAAARDISAKFSAAVVKVSMVFKMQASMEGRGAQSNESKGEVIGTVIDPSGLTVVSLYETSPEDQWKAMGYSEEKGMSLTAEATSVKIRLASGQEIPAKIVLRAEDLDLTFIRPQQKLLLPSPYVDLTQSTKLSQFDQVVSIARLGRVTGRVSGGEIARVYATIEKPRTSYVLDSMVPLGTPVFSLDGKVAGVMVSQRLPVGSSDLGGPGGGYGDKQVYAILPAEDVLDIAKQAPEQAIVETKPAPVAPAPKPTPTVAPKPTPKPAPKPAPKPKSGK
jgi:hypothetical protein